MSVTGVPEHVPADRVFPFDLYADARLLKGDLYEGFAEITRGKPDVFYTPQNGGHWVITRFSVAQEILKDYQNFSVREMEVPRIKEPIKLLPLTVDPPTSTPYRQILMPYFAPKSVAELGVKIRQWAAHFIDRVAAQGECDFLGDVSSRFPVTIFMEMMGIPFDRFDSFRALADEYFRDIPEARRHAVYSEVVAQFTELWEARKIERQHDLISIMVDAKVDGRPLTLNEFQSMSFLLFLAGLDTVVNVLTLGFRALAEDPALQTRLRNDPTAIAGFVEECLRLFGVVNSPRIVTNDFERFGVKFREGDMVVCLNPTFGRDERENPNPMQIDVDRQNRKYLTFSIGPHLCLGHNLARAEIGIFTEEWLKRIGQFQVPAGFKPTFRPGMVMSIKALRLAWPLRAAA
jgi:cytochrome P450